MPVHRDPGGEVAIADSGTSVLIGCGIDPYDDGYNFVSFQIRIG
jgi:hypothetical protein